MTLIEHLPDVASIIVLSADTPEVYLVCVYCYFNIVKKLFCGPSMPTFSHLKVKLPYVVSYIQKMMQIGSTKSHNQDEYYFDQFQKLISSNTEEAESLLCDPSSYLTDAFITPKTTRLTIEEMTQILCDTNITNLVNVLDEQLNVQQMREQVLAID